MMTISKRLHTIREWYEKLPQTQNIFVIGITATMGGMMFGFDVSSISAFVSQEYYRNFFGYPNSTEQGAITAAMSGGSIFGSLFSNHISEPFGRKMALIFCALFWIVGAIVQCSSRNLAQLVCGRIISGFGVGLGSTTAPVYCSEISPASLRGVMGGLYQASLTLGILVMFFIGYGCSFIQGVGSFRLAWGLQMIPGIFLILGVLSLPESPRWLAGHDQWEEAERILQALNKKADQEKIMTEIAELKESVVLDQLAKDTTYLDLFRKKNYKSSIVGISAQIWNQLTGMNVMMYYVVYIFEMVGFTGNTNLVSSSIQYVINFGVTVASLPLPDYIGRRNLMIVGGVVMMVWLCLVGGLFARYSEPIPNVPSDATVVITVTDNTAGKAIVACSYLFVATFASTWAVCSWAFVAEIFPNRTRSKGTSIAVASDWAFNFALAMFTPPAFRNITWKTYFLFASFCGAMAYTFFFYPETKNKTLEEVDMFFQSGIPAWRSKNFIPPAYENESELEKHTISHVEVLPKSS